MVRLPLAALLLCLGGCVYVVTPECKAVPVQPSYQLKWEPPILNCSPESGCPAINILPAPFRVAPEAK